VAIAAVLSAVANQDAPPDGLTIDVVGTCPDAAAVRRALAELVPRDAAGTAPVGVEDRGENVRIAVREAARTISDPARDCAARARMAAAVAATELLAPRTVLAPPKWAVEKGVIFDVTSTSSGAVWSPGAEIRGVYGNQLWSYFAAGGARGPADLMLEHGWQAELLRFPLDVGMRLTLRRTKRFRPWLTLAGTLTLNGIRGAELVQTDRVWRLDVGAMVMLGGTLMITERLGLSAAITFRMQPRYELEVIPAGKVGETPLWWFGIAGDYILDAQRKSPP